MATLPQIYSEDWFGDERAQDELEATGEITLDNEPAPALTWRIDWDSGRIIGKIDELEAVKQYAIKALMTARFRYLIYSDDYGCELEDLIGSDVTAAFIDSEVPRMVREALIYDDRVTDVTDIQFSREGDKLNISLVLNTVYGDIETEVSI